MLKIDLEDIQFFEDVASGEVVAAMFDAFNPSPDKRERARLVAYYVQWEKAKPITPKKFFRVARDFYRRDPRNLPGLLNITCKYHADYKSWGRVEATMMQGLFE